MSEGAQGPNRPVPKPFQLHPTDSGIAVLDQSAPEGPPQLRQSQLWGRLSSFLERVRPTGVPVIFTLSASRRGTPAGEVAPALNRRETEPAIFPDAFDKFISGELESFLSAHNVRNLVVVGSATNNAVMYTATTAARVHHYNVIIPIDGVSARDYEHEYALHQLSVLPRAATPVQFSTLSTIEFS
jgi:nicotinamidase-related amidase